MVSISSKGSFIYIIPQTGKHIPQHLLHQSCSTGWNERERIFFYLTTHSTHFIYGYMASDIWLRIILIVRKETRCRHIGYFYQLPARVLLYAPSHRQDNTYHGLCYTSHGALAGTRNSSIGWNDKLFNGEIDQWVHHEGMIWWPISPGAYTLTTELHLTPTPIFKGLIGSGRAMMPCSLSLLTNKYLLNHFTRQRKITRK